jgi:beta-lactamase superfamily II metal-dependent hydrolase
MARLALFAVLFACGPWRAWAAAEIRMAMLDVGQGDAMALVSPSGCAALIDAGPPGSGAVIKRFLKAEGVRRIDFALISHYHRDHVAGLVEVEEGSDALTVDRVYDRGGSYRTQTYQRYAERFAGRREAVYLGQEIDLCDEVRFRVIASDGNGMPTGQENARSVAVKVSYGNLDVFAGGDLTGQSPDVESRIASQVGDVEIYKVSHHCSNGSSREPLLRALKAEVALISVGARNGYGHPVDQCLGRLTSNKAEVWQTQAPPPARSGDIVVTSDGDRYEVSQAGTSRRYQAE